MEETYHQKYYREHKEKMDDTTIKWKKTHKGYSQGAKYRKFLIKLLGGKCIKCNFNDIRALQLDHINGNGLREIKKFNGGGTMYLYYKRNTNEAKEKLQILCANCNWIKRYENDETNLGQTFNKK